MRHIHIAIALAALAVLSGCAASDSLKLSDGRELTLPASGEVRTWVGENVPDKDIPLVVEACKAAKAKSPRLTEMCQVAEHRAAIIAL